MKGNLIMKRMNVPKIVFVTLLAGSMAVMAGCASQTGQAATTQTAKVTRGNLTTDIVAGGNLQLAQKEDLAFQVAGTVEEVLVKQLDAVEKGQVIARLDNSTLEDNVKTAERAVKSAEIDLSDAEGNVFQIKTAEYDLESKTNNFNKLNYPYSYSTFTLDVPYAIEVLVKAQNQMEEAQKALEKDPQSGEALSKYNSARLNVADALERLRRGQSIDVYSSTNISKTVTDYQTARAAQIAMESSQHNLEQTKRNVQNTIDKTQIALDKANDDLAKAQADLANAIITAPFAGFITKVSVLGGDEIQKGTVAVQLADPARFKTTIMVGETDVFKLKEGMEASIQIDSLPTVILAAMVIQIAPTATIQSGVVNYQVDIEADSLPTAVSQTQNQTGLSRQGNSTFTSGESSPVITLGQAGANAVSNSSQLREGLTVTLNITVSGKKDILLIPGQAVQRSGKDTQVQVVKNGATETRIIKTGISNWQYTEITEGLAEGEEVIIQTAAAATSSANQSQRQGQGGQFIVPGIGVGR
jgi:HlyD family secretion protein